MNFARDADAAAVWSAWAYRTPVRVVSERRLFTRTLLPMTISPDGDGRYADLRVIDERGRETPFAVDPAEPTTSARDVALVSSTFVARHGSEAILDLGRRAPVVDSVNVAVDVEQHPTYFEYLAVDAAVDRRHWHTIRTAAVVYRVADDAGKGDQRVTFAATHARWLRVRVLDPRAPFPLASASVANVRGERAPFVRLPIAPVASIEPGSHRQVWTFSAPQPFRPAAVTFENTSGSFVRPVRIEDGNDGRAWTFVGDGTIASYGDGTNQAAFAFPEDTASAWRVVVENGDDSPLTNARPVLLGVPHEIVFEVEPNRTYDLISGNPAAQAASYDLGVRLAHARWEALPATLSGTVANPRYRGPGTRWQRVAWAAVAIVVFALAVSLAGLALRRRQADDPAPSG